jgi:hypothetical protein
MRAAGTMSSFAVAVGAEAFAPFFRGDCEIAV